MYLISSMNSYDSPISDITEENQFIPPKPTKGLKINYENPRNIEPNQPNLNQHLEAPKEHKEEMKIEETPIKKEKEKIKEDNDLISVKNRYKEAEEQKKIETPQKPKELDLTAEESLEDFKNSIIRKETIRDESFLVSTTHQNPPKKRGRAKGISEETRNKANKLKEKVKEMFYFAYDNYLIKAFPLDELKPISCSGVSKFGGVFLTLIDCMDTVAIMGNRTEFARIGKKKKFLSFFFHFFLNFFFFFSS